MVCLIGIGNEWRRDDGVGIEVVRRVIARGWEGVKVTALPVPDPLELMEAWRDVPCAVIVDAIAAALTPGLIVRVDARRQPFPPFFRGASTHALSIAEAVEILRSLKALPPRLVIYGVIGKDFRHGKGLSPEVADALPRLLGRLKSFIRRHGRKKDA